MSNINDINGVTVANLAKLDAVLKANISKVNGLTLPAAAAFLLDTYTGAAAAYSLRKLKTGVTVAARIRRSGDDIEADVEFDSNNEISLTSPISNASSGTYTDLADFVDHSTTPRDAFVDEWKDQSGSGNHATQSTLTSQPKLYDATTGLITENGKPAIKSFAKNLAVSIALSEFHTSSDTSVSFVYTDTQAATFKVAWGHSAISGGSLEYGYWTARANTNLVYEIREQTGFTRPSGYQNSQHGVFLTNGGTQCEFYMDSSLLGTKSNMNCTNTAGTFYLGTSGYNYPFSGYFQEFVVWPENNQSNRSGIEENINSDFLIYQPTDAPTSGLLATYTGAAAAYSVRQLSDKAVIALRIRRDSDDEERNIGFDANGDLDTTAISDFCGTANGYVTRWADQSTNGNHADQATDTSQPQIYNGTAVLTQGGKPAVLFNGNAHHFDTSANNPFSYTGGVSCIAAVYKDSSSYSSFATLFSAGVTGTGTTNAQKSMGFGYGNFSSHNPRPTFCTDIYKPAGVQYDGTVGTNERQLLAWYISNWSTHRSTGLSNMTLDGSDATTTTYGTVNPTSLNTNPIKIGVFDEILSSSYFAGSMQELIVYASDQNSNRTGIQNDVNDYFSIY